jgi:hypothetical protein
MSIRLNGSTSGYTEIDAPAVAGSNTIVLPSGNGSANQLLKNGSTAGTLGWSSMVETATGVGIGTTSPGFKTEIVDTLQADANLNYSLAIRGDDSGTSGESAQIFLGAINATTRGCAIASILTASANAHEMAFKVSGSSATPTERMRINSSGTVLIGKTAETFATSGTAIYANGEVDLTQSNASPLYVNRTTNDGNLVAFYQDGTIEGSISVSGTTVSYNGAHLSRWSQLPGGATREEILRGTVLSNIDEMCDWGEEENEQLNRMKVSDVEGDPNVAGVFQAWDDDDDTYTDDFYCAMTGDFIIRIAEGVTVERGDLLMSAGDGTAKPQDDDIVRSKTVAKVTSTHVTCTYEDGSYCVPCVLMAC